jgi:N-acetylmuramoyl-L-alanine amidase
MIHKNYLYYQIIFAFSIGIGIHLWYYHWPRSFAKERITAPQQVTRSARITYWYQGNFKHEEKILLWSTSSQESIAYLMQAWLALMDEEGLLPHACTLQSVSLSPSEQEAFISFDHSPLSVAWSTYDCWMIIESLLETLRDNDISVTSLRFLEGHQPLQDIHLDFNKSWPLEGFIDTAHQTTSRASINNTTYTGQCTIILDPASDTRIIDDMFERGITLQYAQALQKELQKKLPQATITVARLPGEIVEPLRNAIVANRMQADLYVSLHCYAEKERLPRCFIAYTRWHQLDTTTTKKATLTLTPYHDAYYQNIKKSYRAAEVSKHALAEQQIPGYQTYQGGIPCQSLLGVAVPALTVECGLYTKHDITMLVTPLAHALSIALSELKKMDP